LSEDEVRQEAEQEEKAVPLTCLKSQEYFEGDVEKHKFPLPECLLEKWLRVQHLKIYFDSSAEISFDEDSQT
jgi:hypothetical protein